MVYPRRNNTVYLADFEESLPLSRKEREEFDELLNWLADNGDKPEEIDALVRRIRDKIRRQKKQPCKAGLKKLREAKEETQYGRKIK